MNENEFTDEAYWTIILFALYEEMKIEHNSAWASFVSDILFDHRFFRLKTRLSRKLKIKQNYLRYI